MFYEHNGIKLKNSDKTLPGKFLNICRLTNF